MSVRSRRRWRMISWPAAKQMKPVKPSIATDIPSRTYSATASRRERRLSVIDLPLLPYPDYQWAERPFILGHDQPARGGDERVGRTRITQHPAAAQAEEPQIGQLDDRLKLSICKTLNRGSVVELCADPHAADTRSAQLVEHKPQ